MLMKADERGGGRLWWEEGSENPSKLVDICNMWTAPNHCHHYHRNIKKASLATNFQSLRNGDPSL